MIITPFLSIQVHVESEYGIEMLQAVFTAVAPGSLWPVDVLLRVLFSSFDQVWNCFTNCVMYVTLSMLLILAVYRVLVTIEFFLDQWKNIGPQN